MYRGYGFTTIIMYRGYGFTIKTIQVILYATMIIIKFSIVLCTNELQALHTIVCFLTVICRQKNKKKNIVIHNNDIHINR